LYLLWPAAVAMALAACASPQVAADVHLGQELPPERGEDPRAHVAVRPADLPREAAPTAAPLPKTIVRTDSPPDVAAPPEDAVKLPSGLSYKVLRAGEGSEAGSGAKVLVHYAGWTTDGALFDSSVVRGEPLAISLTQVIEGWRQGVGAMRTGEVRRLWIPEALAYKGKAGAPAGMLVFDVELMRID
jgi:peptidylprolyl isomerase